MSARTEKVPEGAVPKPICTTCIWCNNKITSGRFTISSSCEDKIHHIFCTRCLPDKAFPCQLCPMKNIDEITDPKERLYRKKQENDINKLLSTQTKLIAKHFNFAEDAIKASCPDLVKKHFEKVSEALFQLDSLQKRSNIFHMPQEQIDLIKRFIPLAIEFAHQKQMVEVAKIINEMKQSLQKDSSKEKASATTEKTAALAIQYAKSLFDPNSWKKWFAQRK